MPTCDKENAVQWAEKWKRSFDSVQPCITLHSSIKARCMFASWQIVFYLYLWHLFCPRRCSSVDYEIGAAHSSNNKIINRISTFMAALRQVSFNCNVHPAQLHHKAAPCVHFHRSPLPHTDATFRRWFYLDIRASFSLDAFVQLWSGRHFRCMFGNFAPDCLFHLFGVLLIQKTAAGDISSYVHSDFLLSAGEFSVLLSFRFARYFRLMSTFRIPTTESVNFSVTISQFVPSTFVHCIFHLHSANED